MYTILIDFDQGGTSMKYFKSYSTLIAITFIFILCLGTFCKLSSNLHDNPFTLETIYGDERALEGITFNGYLSDMYHNQYFTLENGELSSQFNYYDTGDDLLTYEPLFASNLIVDDKEYSYFYNFENSSENIYYTDPIPSKYSSNTLEESMFSDEVCLKISVSTRMRDYLSMSEDIDFMPSLILKSATPIFEFYRPIYEDDNSTSHNPSNFHDRCEVDCALLNSTSSALTYLDGYTYFTIPTTPDFSGENGIYRIDQYNSFGRLSDPNLQKITPLMTFSLDEHNLDIIGIEGLNKQIILILVENGIFTLKSYDTSTGKLISTLALPELDYSTFIYDSGYEKERFKYQSFINGDNLTLCFLTHANNLNLINLKVSDDLVLDASIPNLELSPNETLLTTALAVYYKDNKLFISTPLSEGLYPTALATPDYWNLSSTYSEKVGVFVYDTVSQSLVYKGYIHSDMANDYINLDKRLLDFSDNRWSTLRYSHLSIQAEVQP